MRRCHFIIFATVLFFIFDQTQRRFMFLLSRMGATVRARSRRRPRQTCDAPAKKRIRFAPVPASPLSREERMECSKKIRRQKMRRRLLWACKKAGLGHATAEELLQVLDKRETSLENGNTRTGRRGDTS